MAVFLVFYTAGSWLAWAILKSFVNEQPIFVEIDRQFVATEGNRKRVQRIAVIGELVLALLFWPIIVTIYYSDGDSLESTYVRVFHEKVIFCIYTGTLKRRKYMSTNLARPSSVLLGPSWNGSSSKRGK